MLVLTFQRRKVIERGFNGTDGLTIHATGLRFRCTAAFPPGTSTAYLKSFSAHKMRPPPCWPIPPPPSPSTPFNCSVFECSCKGMADYYGVAERLGGFGCAPQAAIAWWTTGKVPCAQSPMPDSCCQVSDYTTKNAPFPGCGCVEQQQQEQQHQQQHQDEQEQQQQRHQQQQQPTRSS